MKNESAVVEKKQLVIIQEVLSTKLENFALSERET